jgi:RNA polymerase sigma-70 factor (ECF subfamily)
MIDEPDFPRLLQRVRAGDEEAAAQLFRQFEPYLRRIVRLQLTDPRLGRLIDSEDVCQSVFAVFFVRASLGEFELSSPAELLQLLSTMARNRLRDQARRCQAGRRGGGSAHESPAALEGVAADQPTPSRIVSARERLQRVRGLLSEDERRLADQRAAGRTWAEIAAQEGLQPDAARMRLHRALDRALLGLGLEDSDT